MEFISLTEGVIIFKVFVAVLLGLAIGFQREKRKLIEKTEGIAGLRTHALVALGSSLITAVGIFLFPQDPARLAASIMTGIGFIGAGTIIASGGKIKGLANAASIWVSAAIGIAVGLGVYFGAILSTIFTLFILEMERFERID